jgi:HAD superfamily hydrolase (TIGR01509 family)
MALIFDMDGVVVNNHTWHFEAWVEFGRRHGMDITKEEFSKHFGSTNNLVMKSLFGNSISEAQISAFGNEKENIYRELYRPFIKPVEGLPAFLKSASGKGFPIALATSAPRENVTFTLEATGLSNYFSIITDSSMVTLGKPDPQVYLITAEKLGVQPADCIVFEDSIPGILSAKNAGMQVIGVATTHKPEELLMYVNEIIMNFGNAEIILEKWLTNSKYN